MLLLLRPAGVDGASALPVVEGGVLASGDWESRAVSLAQGEVDLVIETGPLSCPAAIGLTLRTADGFAWMSMVAGVGSGEEGVYARVGGSLGEPHEVGSYTPRTCSEPGVTFVLRLREWPSGENHLVAWAAGGAPTARWEMRGTGSVVASASGTGAFYLDEHDFAAREEVFASGPAGVGADAQVGAELEVEVEHSFFALFEGAHPGSHSWEGPEGACTPVPNCGWFFAGGAPGLYRFSSEAWVAPSAGFGYEQNVVLTGADVVLPAFPAGL